MNSASPCHPPFKTTSLFPNCPLVLFCCVVFIKTRIWYHSITRHQNFQTCGKGWEGFYPPSAPFRGKLVGFHSVTPCIKGKESLPTQRCFYTLALTLISAPRRQTNYSFLSEAPCIRCRNQLTTWSFKKARSCVQVSDKVCALRAVQECKKMPLWTLKDEHPPLLLITSRQHSDTRKQIQGARLNA